VDVGQDATFGYGTLAFWKGRHFVSVLAEQESERTRAAVLALGRAVAEAIPEAGERPALVGRLPAAGLDPASVVYLRHPRILEAHVPVGPDNPLGVGPSSPAVASRYRLDGGGADLVLVDYADPEGASSAGKAFAARFLDGDEPAHRGDGWCAAAPSGSAGARSCCGPRRGSGALPPRRGDERSKAMTQSLDRRGFLQIGGGAAAAGVLGLGPAHAAPDAKARVVLVRRREVLDSEGRVSGPVIHAMLNEAVVALLGEKDAAAAWRRLVKPTDVVGVKSNVWGRLPTPPELEQAIRDEVVGAGVSPANVAVDDRGVRSNPVFQRMTAS